MITALNDYGPYLGHPMDPRTPECDALSEDEAREIAEDELMRTPAVLRDTLWPLIPDDMTPVRVDELCRPELDTCGLNAGQLLAIVLHGQPMAQSLAGSALRELLVAAMAGYIAARAAELMSESEL